MNKEMEQNMDKENSKEVEKVKPKEVEKVKKTMQLKYDENYSDYSGSSSQTAAIYSSWTE